MKKIYLNLSGKIGCLIIIISCFVGSCVNGNPSHKPYISGEVEIITKNNQDICFKPKFSNSELDNKKLSNVTFDIMEINKTQPNIANFIWQTNIPTEEYTGTEVCLKPNDALLKEKLIKGKEYTVCMRGFSKSFNQYATFCQLFLYNENEKIEYQDL